MTLCSQYTTNYRDSLLVVVMVFRHLMLKSYLLLWKQNNWNNGKTVTYSVMNCKATDHQEDFVGWDILLNSTTSLEWMSPCTEFDLSNDSEEDSVVHHLIKIPSYVIKIIDLSKLTNACKKRKNISSTYLRISATPVFNLCNSLQKTRNVWWQYKCSGLLFHSDDVDGMK